LARLHRPDPIGPHHLVVLVLDDVAVPDELAGRVDPIAGLPRDDAALTSLITELVMRAEREPASEAAMQLDLLEQRRLQDGISAAQTAGDYEVSSRLARQRAALTERIAHAGAG
jgi:hypothetical protein